MSREFPKRIDRFTGVYEFLSNFAPARVHVLIGGKFVAVPTLEHAFQAYKSPHDDERREVAECATARDAKFLGQKISRMASWEEVKIPIMLGLLREKFSRPKLRRELIFTGDAELIEGNHWHDNFWGDCTCHACSDHPGENWLGKLLMRVRRDIRHLTRVETGE